VAYELLVGATPFEDDERVETIRGILQSEPDIPEFLSQGTPHMDVIVGSVITPGRLSCVFAVTLAYPPILAVGLLYADARDFIRVTLAKNPRDRPTVKQLMAHPWVQEHAEPRSAIYCQGEIHRMLDRGGDLNNRFKEGLSWKGNGQRISAASFLAQGTQLRFGEEVPIPPPQPLHMHPSLESSVLSMCPHGDSAAAGVADDRGHYIEQASVCGKSWNQGDYQDRDSANGCMGVQQSMAKQALGHTQVPEENYGPPLVSPAVPQQSLDDGAMPMDLDEHPSLESLLMRQQH
jgi:serine/threonine protein kinase